MFLFAGAHKTDSMAKPVASVKFDGQNGKVSDSDPLVRADCRKGRKAKR